MIKLYAAIIAVLILLPVWTKAEAVEAASKAEMKQASAGETEGGYVYEPRGRRDPFLPLVETRKKVKDSSKKKAPTVLGTLESYDIPDFKLIAVIKKGKGQYVGMLLSADSKSFIVKKGTVIGLHKGKVTDIQLDKVIVTEYSEDYKGIRRPRQSVLELYEGGAE
jgi:type IV pilus assembly protein PilP